MKNENKKEEPKIEADKIVSPKNTRRLYGSKLDQDETVAGESEATPTSLPEDVDDVDENMFPSAP